MTPGRAWSLRERARGKVASGDGRSGYGGGRVGCPALGERGVLVRLRKGKDLAGIGGRVPIRKSGAQMNQHHVTGRSISPASPASGLGFHCHLGRSEGPREHSQLGVLYIETAVLGARWDPHLATMQVATVRSLRIAAHAESTWVNSTFLPLDPPLRLGLCTPSVARGMVYHELRKCARSSAG